MIRGKDQQGKPFVLLVDPTLRVKPEDYYFDINRRTGLLPSDITHCFSTHAHFDHQIGLNYFPDAQWLAAVPVAEELRTSTFIKGRRVQGVSDEFLPGIMAIPLPGHTDNLHGLAFHYNGLKIVVSADAVMTRNHFVNNTCMFEQNTRQAAQTIRFLKETADLIIPGHDNVIVNCVNRP